MSGSADIYIGTSGYSYRDWVGPFYPVGTKQRDYLDYYSNHFSLVELNFSYYRQPTAEMIEKMALQTPSGFLFAIKGHQSLTHKIDDSWRNEVQTFRTGIAPLEITDKLAGILLQFPFSFHYSIQNRNYLAQLCDELEGLPLNVEFRNRDWESERVSREMEKRGIGIVSVDEPDLPDLPTPEVRTTSSTGYLRFHGRNAEQWWKGDNISRYDYLYDISELEEWLSRIESMSKRTNLVLVVFNNHARGNAVRNAIQLKKLLNDRGCDTV